MRLLIESIPTELWTETVLQFLNDLTMLAVALGPAETMTALSAAAAARAAADIAEAAAVAAKANADKLAAIPSHALAASMIAGARFVATRVLSDAELQWFAAHGIAVALVKERREVHYPLHQQQSVQYQTRSPYQGGSIAVMQPELCLGIHWTTNGVLHREDDLPALEGFNGDRSWYAHGRLHRENGLPAVESANGRRLWLVDGQLHRDGDLPAVVNADGYRAWFVRGKPHRDDDHLPAEEFPSGLCVWWVNHTD